MIFYCRFLCDIRARFIFNLVIDIQIIILFILFDQKFILIYFKINVIYYLRFQMYGPFRAKGWRQRANYVASLCRLYTVDKQ